MFYVFSLSQITIPLYESYKVSKKINNLELTKKGLLKVFQNDILYKEFFEYAVKKRSVEYAIFHIEYLEFKNIFKINKDFIDELSGSRILAPGPEPSNAKDKKMVQLFEEIYKKADDIYTKYFNKESELELNLPAKMVKKVNNRLYDYNIYYNRYIVNGTEGHEIDIKQINCETIFDEVHGEALDSLFLNVYSSFAKDKKKTYGFNANSKVARSNSILNSSSNRNSALSPNSPLDPNFNIDSTFSMEVTSPVSAHSSYTPTSPISQV
ncbi:hypothetical protein H8356DRAFT_960634 [Neocallimastix lanati (nom. inval.)]|nr:hypothetical protein H8356DRAFT_960634 [Neocallimastix sp. JGI-2020a]